MSLINDALKRAKQAQQNNPPTPAPGPQLRPIEPAQRAGDGATGLTPLATILFVVALAVFLAWQWLQKSNSQTAQATAPPAIPEPQPEAAATAPAPVPVKSVEPNSPEQLAGANASQPPAATGTAAATPESATTNGPAAVAVAPAPKPAPLKLQAIVFDSKRPSAIISGKSVFVGDRVGEFHVAAISAESTTLVSATQTNVLSLE